MKKALSRALIQVDLSLKSEILDRVRTVVLRFDECLKHGFHMSGISQTVCDFTGRVPFDQNFRKFRFKIKWNRNFPQIRFENFGSPLETFGISTRYELNPVPLVVKSYKMAASLSSHTTLDAKWPAIVRACSWSKTKTLESYFLENCGLVVPNFLWVSSPGLRTLPREKPVSFSHNWRVEFWKRVKQLYMKQVMAL